MKARLLPLLLLALVLLIPESDALAERMLVGPDALLDSLPEDGAWETYAISSYDRTGGNNDGFDGTYSYLRRDPNGEYVIFEGDGPGALVRMWWTAPDPAKRVRFYFDGEDTPRIDMPVMQLFSGEVFPFLHPLVGDQQVSSGGFYVYLAFPFEESLKITTADIPRFYSFSALRFTDGRPVETYDPEWSSRDRDRLEEILLKLSTRGLDPKEVRNERKQETTGYLITGATRAILDLPDEEGVVTKIRLTMDGENHLQWRKLILRAWWDGAEEPSIEAPVCDFFGTGYGENQFYSLATGMASRWSYCYFPMPFRESARIELVNGSNESIPMVRTEVSWERRNVPDDWHYFFARWQDTVTKAGEYYHILQADGPGKFVGCNISMQGYDLGYLEGDEKIYVDGEETPSTHGTGTEDYFMGGWYYNHGPFSMPYHGLTAKDESQSRISTYRHHIPDSIPFEDSIRVDIEHGPGNDRPGVAYSGMTYWYQASLDQDFFARINPDAVRYPGRRVRSPEDMIQAEDAEEVIPSEGAEVEVRAWEEISDEFQGGGQVYLPAEEGDWVEFLERKEFGDRCASRIYLTQGPEYGLVQVYLNDVPHGNPVNTHGSEFKPSVEYHFPQVQLEDGTYVLRFESLGPAVEGGGSAIGIDGWRFPSESDFVPQVWAIGPFHSPGREEAMGTVYPPEEEIDLEAEYTGKDGETVRWQLLPVGGNHQYDFTGTLSEKEDVIAYAWFRVHTEEPRRVLAMVGSDDGVRVQVNGETVHENVVPRGVYLDQDRFPVDLQAGWNDVLLKIESGIGGWGFAFRFTDPNNLLTYSTEVE